MLKVYEGDKPYLFISYSHADEKAIFYCDYLRRNKCRIWYDEGNHAGEDWAERIGNRLINAKYVLFLISHNSLKSKYVNAEITMALSHKIPVIPVKIEDVDLSPGIELKIGHLHFVNLFDAESNKDECDKLSKEIPNDLFDFSGSPFYRNDIFSFFIDVQEGKAFNIGNERRMSIIAVNESNKESVDIYSFYTPPSICPFYKILGIDKIENGYFDEKNNETLVVQVLCSFDVEYPLYGDRIEALFSIAITNPLGPNIKGIPVSYKIISPKTGVYESSKTIETLKEEAKYYEKSIIEHIVQFFYKNNE